MEDVAIWREMLIDFCSICNFMEFEIAKTGNV